MTVVVSSAIHEDSEKILQQAKLGNPSLDHSVIRKRSGPVQDFTFYVPGATPMIDLMSVSWSTLPYAIFSNIILSSKSTPQGDSQLSTQALQKIKYISTICKATKLMVSPTRLLISNLESSIRSRYYGYYVDPQGFEVIKDVLTVLKKVTSKTYVGSSNVSKSITDFSLFSTQESYIDKLKAFGIVNITPESKKYAEEVCLTIAQTFEKFMKISEAQVGVNTPRQILEDFTNLNTNTERVDTLMKFNALLKMNNNMTVFQIMDPLLLIIKNLFSLRDGDDISVKILGKSLGNTSPKTIVSSPISAEERLMKSAEEVRNMRLLQYEKTKAGPGKLIGSIEGFSKVFKILYPRPVGESFVSSTVQLNKLLEIAISTTIDIKSIIDSGNQVDYLPNLNRMLDIMQDFSISLEKELKNEEIFRGKCWTNMFDIPKDGKEIPKQPPILKVPKFIDRFKEICEEKNFIFGPITPPARGGPPPGRPSYADSIDLISTTIAFVLVYHEDIRKNSLKISPPPISILTSEQETKTFYIKLKEKIPPELFDEATFEAEILRIFPQTATKAGLTPAETQKLFTDQGNELGNLLKNIPRTDNYPIDPVQLAHEVVLGTPSGLTNYLTNISLDRMGGSAYKNTIFDYANFGDELYLVLGNTQCPNLTELSTAIINVLKIAPENTRLRSTDMARELGNIIKANPRPSIDKMSLVVFKLVLASSLSAATQLNGSSTIISDVQAKLISVYSKFKPPQKPPFWTGLILQ